MASREPKAMCTEDIDESTDDIVKGSRRETRIIIDDGSIIITPARTFQTVHNGAANIAVRPKNGKSGKARNDDEERQDRHPPMGSEHASWSGSRRRSELNLDKNYTPPLPVLHEENEPSAYGDRPEYFGINARDQRYQFPRPQFLRRPISTIATDSQRVPMVQPPQQEPLALQMASRLRQSSPTPKSEPSTYSRASRDSGYSSASQSSSSNRQVQERIEPWTNATGVPHYRPRYTNLPIEPRPYMSPPIPRSGHERTPTYPPQFIPPRQTWPSENTNNNNLPQRLNSLSLQYADAHRSTSPPYHYRPLVDLQRSHVPDYDDFDQAHYERPGRNSLASLRSNTSPPVRRRDMSPFETLSNDVGDRHEQESHYRFRRKAFNPHCSSRSASSEWSSANSASAESDGTDATTSSSFWFSDESGKDDDPVLLDRDHPFLQVKDITVKILLKKFRGWQISCPASSQRPLQPAGPLPDPSNGGDSTKKRRKGGGEGIKDNEGDDESQTSLRASNKRRRTASNELTFACPFSKKDPEGYRNCYRYTLTRIRDVKQHLKRRHKMPIYCPNCGDTSFGSVRERDEHLRQRVRCETRGLPTISGVTEEQSEQLSRKLSSKLTAEEKWYAIFDVLFPGHQPRPDSPYINASLLQEIVQFHEYSLQHAPTVVSQILEVSGASTLDLANVEQDRATFLAQVVREVMGVVFNQWANQDGISLATSQSTNRSARSGNSSEQRTPSSGASQDLDFAIEDVPQYATLQALEQADQEVRNHSADTWQRFGHPEESQFGNADPSHLEQPGDFMVDLDEDEIQMILLSTLDVPQSAGI